MTTPLDFDTVTRQLANLDNMGERLAAVAFKQSFRAVVRARAQAAGSTVSYRDGQGRLVQERPDTGAITVLTE